MQTIVGITEELLVITESRAFRVIIMIIIVATIIDQVPVIKRTVVDQQIGWI